MVGEAEAAALVIGMLLDTADEADQDKCSNGKDQSDDANGDKGVDHSAPTWRMTQRIGANDTSDRARTHSRVLERRVERIIRQRSE